MKIVSLKDRFAQNPKSKKNSSTCLLCEAVSGESSGLLSGLERSHRVGNCQDSPLSGTSLQSQNCAKEDGSKESAINTFTFQRSSATASARIAC